MSEMDDKGKGDFDFENLEDESKGCCFVVERWLYSIASMRTELEVDN